MLRLVVLLAAAGCADQTARSCDLDAQVTADVAQQKSVVDCGRALDVRVDGGLAPAMIEGHRCVLDSIGALKAFTFLYADPKSGLESGISGLPQGTGGKMLLRWYTTGAPGSKQLSVERCADGIQAAPSCTPAAGVPCLQCIAPAGSLLCSG